MPSDWDESDTEVKPAATPSRTAVPAQKPAKSKWQDEEDEQQAPVSDWEASSDSESEKVAKTAVTSALPPKKKGTFKAKLAEKANHTASGAGNGDIPYDSDDVLDPRQKAMWDKERELAADLNAAKDLLGASHESAKAVESLLSLQPRKKEEFEAYSSKIVEVLIKPYQANPHYTPFLEHHVRQLAAPLSDVELRKIEGVLGAMRNEKKEQQKKGGSVKKKNKGTAKPILGSAKLKSRLDTSAYTEALDDDLGPDDFM